MNIFDNYCCHITVMALIQLDRKRTNTPKNNPTKNKRTKKQNKEQKKKKRKEKAHKGLLAEMYRKATVHRV